jgi:multicomponent Na+:H+ antiporter subunit D
MFITLNPGFVLALASLLIMGAPKGLRSPTMAGAALVSLWLLLDRQFGTVAAMAQMGLPVVLLNLDALNRIFGIAMLIVLIVIAIYSGARRSRFEDAAILLLAGAAVSALFVGDLVSFVAAAELAGLAAAWVVFASPLAGADRAGIRLLVWHGLEGLLFLVGVALHLSTGAGSSIFARLDLRNTGDAFIFLALMIRIGAPLAHVWLKDAVAHASAVGAPAISAFSTALGLYALTRLFPAEPLLVGVGLTMLALGTVLAMAHDDVRAAGACGLLAIMGICTALIGAGSQLALTAAEGLAFTAIMSFAAFQMALGCVLDRKGNTSAAAMKALAQSMPLTAVLLLVSGLAAAMTPGFAAYATLSVTLQATAQWETRFVWSAIECASAALFVGLAIRPAVLAFGREGRAAKRNEAPFRMLLGTAMASFFCLSVGLAPGWLYGLMPSELNFQPFASDQLAPQLELLGAAGAVYALCSMLGLLPRERALRLVDFDALYRGPVASGLRWAGIITLRFFGAIRDALQVGAQVLGRWARARVRVLDQPYAQGRGAALPIIAVAAAVAVVLLSVNR